MKTAATRSPVCTVARRFELHSYFVSDPSAAHRESLSVRRVDSEDNSDVRDPRMIAGLFALNCCLLRVSKRASS